MRSNVVDANRPPRTEVRYPGSSYEPVFQSQLSPSPPRRPPVKPASPPPKKRRFSLTPTEGWLAMLLLAVALYCVVFSIIAAQWIKPGSALLWSPAVGLVIGFIISKVPRLPQAVLHLAACLVGYWLSVWLTSMLAYHVSWVLVLVALRAALTGHLSVGATPTSDMIFFFYLSFLSFFLGYFGSWLIYRAHLPWLVALVYSSIMLVNLNYVKTNSFYVVLLVAILAGALSLLIARMHIITQVLQWRREGLHTDQTWLHAITWRCMQVACVITLITMLFGIILPFPNSQPQDGKIFWDRLDNVWNNLANGRFSWQDVGALTQPYQPSANYFGDQLTITGSVTLPMGEVLFYTSTSGPHYLEGFTYNHFDGHTWTTSLTSNDTTRYATNAPLPSDANGTTSPPTTTSITIIQPPQSTKSYIFGPAQPISFDVPTIVYSDGTASAWTMQSSLTVGQHYLVTSAAPSTDLQALSAYPLPINNPSAWQQSNYYNHLSNDYLAVPNDLSVNEKQTLKQWTQGATSAYGALKMLESHLSDQTHFTYSVTNPPIPSNADVVDWLLQTRRGYCTSYASAMAVMARQLGIPTRMTNGFSNGQFDAQRNVWSVAGTDAHSWVQAYFPNYGWVNFDPTPGYAPNAAPTAQPTPKPQPTQAAATHPITPTPTSTTQPINNKQKTQLTQTPGIGNGALNPNLLMSFSIGVFLLSLVLFLYALVRYWWRNLYANSSFISGVYWRFCYITSWLGLAPRSWQTPYEYSRMLSQQFPQQARPLWRLTELFVRERYAAPHQAPRPQDEEAVERLWPTLRSLLLHLFLNKVKKK